EETFEQAFAKAREEGKEKFKFSGKDNKGRVKEGVFTTEIAEDTVDLKTKTDNNKNVETTTETSGESLSVNDRENNNFTTDKTLEIGGMKYAFNNEKTQLQVTDEEGVLSEYKDPKLIRDIIDGVS